MLAMRYNHNGTTMVFQDQIFLPLSFVAGPSSSLSNRNKEPLQKEHSDRLTSGGAPVKIGAPGMTFLPIVERELRVAARRRGTYGMRMKIAGGATLAFAACFEASQIAPTFQFGKSLFVGLSGLCLLYCLGAGRLMTADCLSREKREGTLGLLFLTDLKGFDVVLGKLAATSLDGFYGLLAVFPLLAIPLLTGGMTNGELWRMALVLVNTFLFSLAIGLFVSAVCRDEQKAMAGNFGLLLLLAAVPPAIDGLIMMSATRPPPMIHEFFYSCPVYSFWQVADVEFKKSPGHFWKSIGITFNLTCLLVLLACRVAPRAWQDKPVSPRLRRQKGERRRRWWREGRLEKADAFRQRLLGVNAYFWLAARPYLKVSYVWTCVLSIGLWWLFITLLIGHNEDATNYGMAFLLNGMLKLWIISEGGHQLARDKKSGAFELLLSTPLTVADMVRGQWRALRWQFLKPVAVAVFLELVLMVSVRHIQEQENLQARWIWLAGILMFLADLWTAGWVAMSAALTEKNQDRATLKTAAFVLALPWLLFGAVLPMTQLWIILFSRKEWEPSWAYYLSWWFGLGIFLDLFLLVRARRRVQTNFRQLALEPWAPKSRFAWLRDWREGSPERKTLLRAKLRRLAVGAAALLLIGAGVALYLIRSFHVDLPKPIIVSISQSNSPTRVVAGNGGFLFIMPDGTIWRWVHPRPRQSGPFQPQQVGTDHGWVQASLTQTNAIGLRADGSLWEWVVGTEEPKQVGFDHDWVEARASYDSAMARKRDGTLWARGNNYQNQLGNGPGPNRGEMTQVGTNCDWTAINTTASSAHVLALRADGTLWTWGTISYYMSGSWSFSSNTHPIQVCLENDWVGFNDGVESGVRNRAGQSWSLFPFKGRPGADVPISAIGELASSNSTALALGVVFANTWSIATYETRSNGTLWATPNSWPLIFPPLAPPLRLGQRSDWISVSSTYGTMIGLTSDGTLWTWGLDLGQEPHFDFGDRLGFVKRGIESLLGGTPRQALFDGEEGFGLQKEPRPLLRVVVANSAGGNSLSLHSNLNRDPNPHP
jgi:ABC-type multidrug transport system permease subunit